MRSDPPVGMLPKADLFCRFERIFESFLCNVSKCHIEWRKTTCFFVEVFEQKTIDIFCGMLYNIRALRNERAKRRTASNRLKKLFKKSQKTLKKCLTRGRRCGIITRSREKRRGADLWKLNNKRWSTKHIKICVSANESRQFTKWEYYSTKVKKLRARLESRLDHRKVF